MDTRNTKKIQGNLQLFLLLFIFSRNKNIYKVGLIFYLSFRIPPSWADENVIPNEGRSTSHAGAL